MTRMGQCGCKQLCDACQKRTWASDQGGDGGSLIWISVADWRGGAWHIGSPTNLSQHDLDQGWSCTMIRPSSTMEKAKSMTASGWLGAGLQVPPLQVTDIALRRVMMKTISYHPASFDRMTLSMVTRRPSKGDQNRRETDAILLTTPV